MRPRGPHTLRRSPDQGSRRRPPPYSWVGGYRTARAHTGFRRGRRAPPGVLRSPDGRHLRTSMPNPCLHRGKRREERGKCPKALAHMRTQEPTQGSGGSSIRIVGSSCLRMLLNSGWLQELYSSLRGTHRVRTRFQRGWWSGRPRMVDTDRARVVAGHYAVLKSDGRRPERAAGRIHRSSLRLRAERTFPGTGFHRSERPRRGIADCDEPNRDQNQGDPLHLRPLLSVGLLSSTMTGHSRSGRVLGQAARSRDSRMR